MSKIRTFSEYQVDKNQLFEAKEAYDAGIKEATEYYEDDRIKIHEYYSAKVRELVGNEEEELEPYSENNGKLT